MLKLKRIPFASVLSVAALLANLAAPMSAHAATAISVIGIQVVNVSTTSTDYKDLGDVKVKVSIADLNNLDFFFLRLPTDFKINIPAATSSTTNIAGATITKPDGSTEPLLQVVGGGTDPWNDGAVNHVSVFQTNTNELKVVVNNVAKAAGAGTDTDTNLKISLGSVYVPGNTNSTINAVIEGKSGSALKNDSVIVANKGMGLVTVSVDSVKTIPEGGIGTLDTLRLKEDVSGAFKTGSSSIKLKLPYGFEWKNNSYTVSFVDGDSGAVGEISATRSSDARELVINVPTATSAASYFTINQAEIEAKDSTVKFGEIVLEVSGSSSTDTRSLVVGNYADYRTTVSAENPKMVMAGRAGLQDPEHTELGQLVLEENAPGSIRAGATIRIELTGGVKWAVDRQGQLVQPPQIAHLLSDLQGLELDTSVGKNGWELVGNAGKTIEATIQTASTGTKGAKLVFEKGLLDIPFDASEADVNAMVDGTAGVTGDAGVIAQVVAPVSMELADSFVKPVQGGVQNQIINDIVLKEAVAGAIGSSNSDSCVRFTFEPGVVPNTPDPSQIQVDGDLVLNTADMATKTDSQGRWVIEIPVQSGSTVASTITLKGQKVTVDRTVPEGDLIVSLNETEGADMVGSVTAANVIIPKNGNVMKSAVFVIGSTSYTVNGQAKTSDAAPFIDKNGRTQLPVRAVAEAFGAIVGWDPQDQTVSILKDGKAISITVGSWVMNVGGVFIQNDSPAVNKGGRVYLPIRVIAEALGANVEWDAATQTVYLN